MRTAAAAGLVASGLFVGGAGGALALAGPALDTLSLDQGLDQGSGPAPGGDVSAKDDTGGQQPDAKKPDDTGDKPSDKPPDPKLDDKKPDAGDQGGEEATKTP